MEGLPLILPTFCIQIHKNPKDSGAFLPYLLNYMILKPGEAIFLPANEPHAYLSGTTRSKEERCA